MPDKYVERYGPIVDPSRQSVTRPLSRPVKRRSSTEDEGQKKKGQVVSRQAILCLVLLYLTSRTVASGRPVSRGRGSCFKSSTSRSNWNFKVPLFVEEGKPENPGKNPRSRERTNNRVWPSFV